jgi:hypothetical protein
MKVRIPGIEVSRRQSVCFEIAYMESFSAYSQTPRGSEWKYSKPLEEGKKEEKKRNI